MPKALERSLKATARKRGYSEERADRYVYGTLRKTGWTPKRERKYKHGSGVLEGNACLRKIKAL